MDESDLPADLRLLWEQRDRPRRGPKSAVNLESVVQAAIELADAEGLDQLSMSRVSERLGFTTMAVYRYVKSKDDLLTHMGDAANQVPPKPTPRAWRRGLEHWARGIQANYRAHPWMTRLPVTGPPIGPRQLTWMETGLANLAATGLREDEKLAVIQTIHGYVRGEAQFSAELLRAARNQPPPTVTYGQALRLVTAEDSHPAIHQLLESGVLDEPTDYTDADFEFGLQRILDGVDRLVTRGLDPRRD